jgi:hypothetical protein
MPEHEQALAHFLKWMPLFPEYIGTHAIPEYFKRCPWAEPLIGEQLREAWTRQQREAA